VTTEPPGLEELYHGVYRRLVGQLTAVTGSRAEAEDVVQEAFVRALAHRGRLQELDRPEAWLRTVATNIARTRWRRRHRFARLLPVLAGPPAADPPPDLAPERLALLEALATLPLAQREAIALHHLADLPVAEVAETLGVPVGTVKARLSRGRAALGVLLTDPEEVIHG
jgi:RNA polymerase sigma-70 factor (ECF subfamily)